jgi:hypothetical protein
MKALNNELGIFMINIAAGKFAAITKEIAQPPS